MTKRHRKKRATKTKTTSKTNQKQMKSQNKTKICSKYVCDVVLHTTTANYVCE